MSFHLSVAVQVVAEVRVVDWKAFAGPDKRVVFESGGLVRLKDSGEVDQTVARKELLDNFPAGVGGAAG